MAKKPRTIASFSGVANEDNFNDENKNKNEHEVINKDKNNEDPKINFNDKDKNENKDNDKKEEDKYDEIINHSDSKVHNWKLKGIYFEPDVAAAIDRIAKGKSKGAKSDLVNAAVREVFQRKGWM